MKWFRKHLKHGSRLALFALAIQFALSFGHFHGAVAQAAPAIVTGLTQADLDHARSFAAQDTANKAGQLPQAIELLYLTVDAEFVHLNPVHPAFQPRAPPAS